MSKISYIKSFESIKNSSLFIEQNYDLGQFYRLKLPFNALYVVTDPKIVQHILIREEANYPKSKIYWSELRKKVGRALATLDGDEWIWMKRLQRPFFTHEKARQYLPETLRISRHFLAQWPAAICRAALPRFGEGTRGNKCGDYAESDFWFGCFGRL